MFGLTPLGVIHTAASLVAIVAAIVAFARHKEISMRQRAGQVAAGNAAMDRSQMQSARRTTPGDEHILRAGHFAAGLCLALVFLPRFLGGLCLFSALRTSGTGRLGSPPTSASTKAPPW